MGIALTPGDLQTIVRRLERGGSLRAVADQYGFRTGAMRTMLLSTIGRRRYRQLVRPGVKKGTKGPGHGPLFRTSLEPAPRVVQVDPAELELGGDRVLRIARLDGAVTITYGFRVPRAISTATSPAATIRIPRAALPALVQRLQQAGKLAVP